VREARLVLGLVVAGTVLVAMLGLAAEIAYFTLGLSGEITEIFSLSYEANVPTWWATILLFSCAIALASTALHEERLRGYFWALAILFAYMSLDEAVQIHEELARVYEGGRGVLYFSWVIPGAVIVVLVGLAFVPFLIALDASTRARFVIAGAIYVGGALVMELPLGWWTDTYGEETLGYALIDFVEETMELAGTGVFLDALLRRRVRSA
jgi:hypothetical protein